MRHKDSQNEPSPLVPLKFLFIALKALSDILYGSNPA